MCERLLSNTRYIGSSGAAIAVAAAALLSVSGARADGLSAAVKSVYESSHTVMTNIPGITTFAEPPAGFDPLKASDVDLARYGFPPRPDAVMAATQHAAWVRAMAHQLHRSRQPLVAKPMYSKPRAAVAGDTSGSSYNWSGIASLVPLKTWNDVKSFYYVVSDFNVPAAIQTPGTCDGGWDYEVTWNGIDGYNNGDVLQGGSLSGAYCSGSNTAAEYFAWIEWYPSYPILEAFGVNVGDDLFVETYDTSSTEGYVYVADLTTGVAGTYNLQPTEKPYLVGDSAEYIVERPCCNGSYLYTLADYVQDFWADNYAVTFADIEKYPGTSATTNVNIQMLDDQGSAISYVTTGGTQQLFFQAEGCTASGGCAP